MTDDKGRDLYDDADPDAALRRLESLGRGGAATGDGPPRQQPRAAGPPARDARPVPAAKRLRPSAALGPSRRVRLARLAAPVVFLVAVIVVFSLAWRTGVIGGGDASSPVASPSPKASPTEKSDAEPTAEPTGASGTKTYTVKSGDTLSAIATRFDTTVTAIEELNADQELQTLTPGQKLKVPASSQ